MPPEAITPAHRLTTLECLAQAAREIDARRLDGFRVPEDALLRWAANYGRHLAVTPDDLRAVLKMSVSEVLGQEQ